MTNWKQTLKSYQQWSNQELHTKLIETGFEHRRSAVRCIALLSESKRRNDYARRAYSSLAKYAFDVLKIPSISTAYRYADVAKFCQEFPEVLGAIENGEMSIETAVLLNQTFREDEKRRPTEAERLKSKCDLSPEFDLEEPKTSDQLSMNQKREIIESVKDQTSAEAQKTIAESIESMTGKVAPNQRTTARIKRIDSKWNEVRIVLDDEELEMLQRLRSLLSHKTGDADLNSTILRLMADGLAKYDPIQIEERARKRKQKKNLQKKSVQEEEAPIDSLRPDSDIVENSFQQMQDSSALPASKESSVNDAKRSQTENFSSTQAIPNANSRQMWLDYGLRCTYHDPLNLAPMCSVHNRVIKNNLTPRSD